MYNIAVECKEQEQALLRFLGVQKMNHIVGIINENDDFFGVRKSRIGNNMNKLVNKYLTKIVNNTPQLPYKIQVITKPDSYIMLLLDKKGNKIHLRGDGALERLNIYLKSEAYKWANELRDYGLMNNTTTFYLNLSISKEVKHQQDIENMSTIY